MPLIELRCEWRAGSTSRLGVVAYRTGSGVVPWYSFLLIKTENENMYGLKKSEWDIRKRSRTPKRER